MFISIALGSGYKLRHQMSISRLVKSNASIKWSGQSYVIKVKRGVSHAPVTLFSLCFPSGQSIALEVS